jgi:serine/threonine protein kinase
MLNAGLLLGPYEIIGPLGAGGMGEVYRARDTRLGRDVAIQVLPAHLSANPELRARFEREARAISRLNHPHICTLHDIGHQEDIDYLVMECLEGETLAARLGKGALPPAEALRHGIEIANALDCAHRGGIVHRDLKPGYNKNGHLSKIRIENPQYSQVRGRHRRFLLGGPITGQFADRQELGGSLFSENQ